MAQLKDSYVIVMLIPNVANVRPYRVSIYMGVWRHSTLHNIHMDTNMDRDTECIISHMECVDLVY